MTALRCTEIDIDQIESGDEFLQSPVWARHKSAFGWRSRAFRFFFADRQASGGSGVEDELTEGSWDLLVLTRRIAPLLSLSYLPHGPSLSYIREIQAGLYARGHSASPAQILSLIGALLKPQVKSSIFVRFDLDWPLSSAFSGSLAGRSLDGTPAFSDSKSPGAVPGATQQGTILADADSISWEDTGFTGRGRLHRRSGMVKSSADIQPPDTVLIPIDKSRFSEEDILSSMKSKTRYNIRLAGKKGVEVRRIERTDYTVPPELHQWYELYRITEQRNNIALHSRRYYARLFELTKSADCFLYMAYHQEDLLAGIIVVSRASKSWYLYGASSNVKRNLMPSYALQWRAILDLREKGCTLYDMFGIPPYAEKGHPMFGLYQFKTGFAGRIIHTPGAWDRPLMPILYSMYRMAEALRMYYYRVFRKRRNR